MEVVLGDPCQEFVTVEASRNPRFHNKFAVLGPRRVLPGPFAPMNSKLCVVSMDSVAPLMRGRVNVGFSVIAEWLSEWGITLAITWPPKARKLNKDHQGAAQVYGIVSRFPAYITDDLVRGRCAWRFETTSWGQSPRHHGMQRHSPDSHHVQASCEILTDA